MTIHIMTRDQPHQRRLEKLELMDIFPQLAVSGAVPHKFENFVNPTMSNKYGLIRRGAHSMLFTRGNSPNTIPPKMKLPGHLSNSICDYGFSPALNSLFR